MGCAGSGLFEDWQLPVSRVTAVCQHRAADVLAWLCLCGVHPAAALPSALGAVALLGPLVPGPAAEPRRTVRCSQVCVFNQAQRAGAGGASLSYA